MKLQSYWDKYDCFSKMKLHIWEKRMNCNCRVKTSRDRTAATKIWLLSRPPEITQWNGLPVCPPTNSPMRLMLIDVLQIWKVRSLLCNNNKKEKISGTLYHYHLFSQLITIQVNFRTSHAARNLFHWAASLKWNVVVITEKSRWEGTQEGSLVKSPLWWKIKGSGDS